MPQSQPPLPALTVAPASGPDSCLTLSTTLLAFLISLLPKSPSSSPPSLLSIGSGTGLLEALLFSHYTIHSSAGSYPPLIHGIEPTPGTANKYLPLDSLHLVPGTWALLDMVTVAKYDVVMFVYPRERALVGRYLDGIAGIAERDGDGNVTGVGKKVVVWAGARVDWEDFRGEFEGRFGWRERDVPGALVAEWEVVRVWEWVGDGNRDGI